MIAILALQCTLVAAQQTDIATYFHPNRPSCAFDEIYAISEQSNPNLARERQHFLREIIPLLASGTVKERGIENALLTIPVVFHIVHSGQPEGQGSNIPTAQILAQLRVLNEDFNALNQSYYKTPARWAAATGGANIQFCLATVDPSGNPATGIVRHNLEITGTSWSSNNINSAIKPSIRWDPTRYMNIYVVAIPGTTASGGVVGYSNYPMASQVGNDQDGIVVDYRWFGGPGFPVSGWSTVTHEAGHYLGLPHTFQGNSCSSDDGINDTPNIDKSTRDAVTLDCEQTFPSGPVSCGNEHMYVNFMDYVSENCYTSFTKGQINLMRAVLNGTSIGMSYGSRAALVNNAATKCNLLSYDAGLLRLLSPNQVTCTNNTITPSLTIRNFGSNQLNSVLIIRKYANDLPDTTFWTGSLSPGENLDISLNSFTPVDGIRKLLIYTASPNGFQDQFTGNDTIKTDITTYIRRFPQLFENFETEDSFPTKSGLFALDIGSDKFEWELSRNISAYGQGTRSAFFENAAGTVLVNPFGTLDAIVTPYYSFSSLAKPQLSFDVAYAPDGFGFKDSLLVMVAKGCSQVFTDVIYSKGVDSLPTAPPTFNTFFPTSTQWRTEIIDLSAYQYDSAVAIAIVNLSGWGNRVYIDNIKLGRPCSTLVANLTTVPTACKSCSGETSLSVMGGNGDTRYQWSYPGVGETTRNLGQLCAGNFSVTVTDALGCTTVATSSIGIQSKPSGLVTTTKESALNSKDATAKVIASGGKSPYTYSWSNGTTGSETSGLAAGNHFVEITDANQCDTIIYFNIELFNCSTFTINSIITNVSCSGGSNGEVEAFPEGTGPFTYSWNNGLKTKKITGLNASNYTVTVTNQLGCTSTLTVSLTQPVEIKLTVEATNETAVNAKNGTASARASGGMPNYTFNWSNGVTGAFINNLAPGQYRVTVTDAGGCTQTSSVNVNTYSCGSFAGSTSITHVSCFGGTNGTATANANAGTEPYSYSWSNGGNTKQISNLASGSYNVTIRDGAGCTLVNTVAINQPLLALNANASAIAVTGVGRSDGSASANPSGGTPAYTYQWSNGALTATISNLIPGNYTVTVTDQNGCTKVQTVNVGGVSCNLSISLSATSTSCPGSQEGTAEVTTVQGASGNLNYKWSNGSASFYISNLNAGVYSVTVTDGLGCSKSDRVEVKAVDNLPPVLKLKSAELTLDIDGKVSLQPSQVAEGTSDNCSVVNYNFSKSSFDCSNIGNNTVTVLASDLSGNTVSGTVNVKIVDKIKPVITCPANVVQAFCTNVTYALPVASDNCRVNSLALVSGQVSGSDFKSGTSKVTWRALDASGNEATCTFDVTVGNGLAAAINGVTHATNGLSNGKVDYKVTGGSLPYILSWVRNGVQVAGFNPQAASAGTYQLLVNDSGGCSASTNLFAIENLTNADDEKVAGKFIIYPNPVKDVLTLEYELPMETELKLTGFDLHGRRLFAKKIRGIHGQIQIEEYKWHRPGVYVLKIETGEQVFIKKLTKI